jgi:hypothetical protein
MATLPNTARWLRRGAFAAGVVAALTLAVIGRVAPGRAPFALDATVTTGPTGELAVYPVGHVAEGRALAPGRGSLHGRVALENQTDARLGLRVQMRPSISDADSALQVRISGPGGVLYSGPAGGLREPSRAELALAARGRTQLDVAAWVAPGAAGGWRGRNVTLPLEYVTSVHGKVRR